MENYNEIYEKLYKVILKTPYVKKDLGRVSAVQTLISVCYIDRYKILSEYGLLKCMDVRFIEGFNEFLNNKINNGEL